MKQSFKLINLKSNLNILLTATIIFLSGCSLNTPTKNSYSYLSAYNSGDWERAERLITAKIESGNSNADLYYMLGNICNDSKRPEKAIQHYQKALDLNPNHHKARHNLGVVYLKQGIYEISDAQKHLPVDDKILDELRKILRSF